MFRPLPLESDKIDLGKRRARRRASAGIKLNHRDVGVECAADVVTRPTGAAFGLVRLENFAGVLPLEIRTFSRARSSAPSSTTNFLFATVHAPADCHRQGKNQCSRQNTICLFK